MGSLLNYLILIAFFIVLGTSCSLLNSGALSVKYKEDKAIIDGRTYERKRKISNGSISFKNIQHPSIYGRWNISMSLTPSIHLDRSTLETDHQNTLPDGRKTDYPDIKMDRAWGFINVGVVTHTPLGAFALKYGYGLALFHMNNSQELKTYRTTQVEKYELNWIAFMTKRFFFLTGPSYYYYSHNWAFSWAFRLGLYWGKTGSSGG